MMQSEPISDYAVFARDGYGFCNRAIRGDGGQPFPPQLTFQLVAMGIEKLSMALLLAHGRLADNHTMTDLVDALRALPEMDESLLHGIASLERFEDLCPFAPPEHSEPSADDVPELIALGQQMVAFTEERLSWVVEV